MSGQYQDYVGVSVATSADGRVVAFGAESGQSGSTTNQAGFVTVVEWNGNAWAQRGNLLMGQLNQGKYGYSLAMSADGSVLAVGSPYHWNVHDVSSSGQVDTFTWFEGQWSKIGETPSWSFGTFWGDTYMGMTGHSVALSADGTVLAVGEPADESNHQHDTADQGRVRAYKYNGYEWVQRGYQIYLGHIDDLNTGWAVALNIDGRVLAVASPRGPAGVYGVADDDDDDTSTNAGHVRVYEWNDYANGWIPRGPALLGEEPRDQFGFSVAFDDSGDVIAIGGRHNDPTGALENAGHVRAFAWNGGEYIQRGADIDGETAGEQRGWSVSLSGDGRILAVSEISFDPNNQGGPVRVFAWDGTAWVLEVATIWNDADYAPIHYGTVPTHHIKGLAVALSANGQVLAAGHMYHDSGAVDSGEVRIFGHIDAVQASSPPPPPPRPPRSVIEAARTQPIGDDFVGDATTDELGYRVALSADGTVLAMMYGRRGSYGGVVRVYAWDHAAAGWAQRGADIYGPLSSSMSSDRSLALSHTGTIMAIGYTAAQANTQHRVRVFQWTNDAWDQMGSEILGTALTNYEGTSVALSADGLMLATGAPWGGPNSYGPSNAGHVRVWVWDGIAEMWVQRGADVDGDVSGDKFGTTVALSDRGDVLAVGAVEHDGPNSQWNRGHVRVWDWSGTAWVPRGSDLDGEAAADWSGEGLSMSGDGLVLAIGAYGNDDGGNQAGHVRVYGWVAEANAWERRGQDIDGVMEDAYAGQSLALSTDGLVLAVAERGHGSEIDVGYVGRVRVFAWHNNGVGAWVLSGAPINNAETHTTFGTGLALDADGSVMAVGSPGHDSYRGLVRVYGRFEALPPPSPPPSPSPPPAPPRAPQPPSPPPFYVNTPGYVARRGYDLYGETILINNYGNHVSEMLGSDLAMSGDGLVLAAGQHINPNTPFTYADYQVVYEVKVYAWNGTDWAVRGAPIPGPAGSEDTQIGFSLSLSDVGDVIAIGSPWYEIHGAAHVGEARVYAWNGTGWAQRGGDLPLLLGSSFAFQDFQQARDRFGYSISLSGDGTIVAVGARGSGQWNGGSKVHVYKWRGGPEWVPYGAMTGYPKASIMRSPSVGDDDDLHAIRLTRDGRTLVVGWAGTTTVLGNDQYSYNHGRGEVRVYDVLPFGPSDVRWTQRGAPILGETADEQSGSAVSVSDDGNVVVIGSPHAESSGGTPSTGSVRAFTWNGTAWVQLGATLHGIPMVGSDYGWPDTFGHDVQLNANGDVLAASAPGYERGKGRVQAYTWSGAAWVPYGPAIEGFTGDGSEIHDETINSGHSVAMSAIGDTLADGAPFYRLVNSSSTTGRVRVFVVP